MVLENRGSGIAICWFLCLGVLLLPQASASAQVVTATVPVAGGPVSVAVNSLTNKIYVADFGRPGNVTVIDGATNSTTTVLAGLGSIAVAVNPLTNKIYVANRGNPIFNIRGSITVIDGRTNSATTIKDPNATFLFAVAVNPVTNKIYVANIGNVTVIDGKTNATTTVTDPNAAFPVAVAVNPVTNKIYVANVNSGNVTVIDGATNSTTSVPVTATSELGDGRTNSTTTVIDPNAQTDLPGALAVDAITDNIYVGNVISGNVTVIHGPKRTF